MAGAHEFPGGSNSRCPNCNGHFRIASALLPHEGRIVLAAPTEDDYEPAMLSQTFLAVVSALVALTAAADYFPPADSGRGWRTATNAAEMPERAEMDPQIGRASCRERV